MDTCVVFDEHPTDNVLLTRAQELYDATRRQEPLLFQRNDPVIANAIERGARHRRIRPAPTQSRYLPLTGQCYELNHVVTRALDTLAEPYRRWLQANGHTTAYLFPFPPSTQDYRPLDDMVQVRLVGIGGRQSEDVLTPNLSCDAKGYARGVRRRAAPG